MGPTEFLWKFLFVYVSAKFKRNLVNVDHGQLMESTTVNSDNSKVSYLDPVCASVWNQKRKKVQTILHTEIFMHFLWRNEKMKNFLSTVLSRSGNRILTPGARCINPALTQNPCIHLFLHTFLTNVWWEYSHSSENTYAQLLEQFSPGNRWNWKNC